MRCEIVESVALVPDLVLRSLYIKQCSRLLEVNEQALLSEMNKVLRKQYRKKQGGEEVPEERLSSDIAPVQPTVEDLGTTPQERDLLRMLLSYGHERITVKFQNVDDSEEEEETSVAELMFELLALDDILFDEPIFRAIYLDYRHRSNLGTAVNDQQYVGHEDESWRRTAIDLLTDKYLLSKNWKERHKIRETRERSVEGCTGRSRGHPQGTKGGPDDRDRQETLKTSDEIRVMATLQGDHSTQRGQEEIGQEDRTRDRRMIDHFADPAFLFPL
ncbi:MAG: hypothetical protein IPO87_13875 [Flavobacteriales bacterium]|nr:hypothetical protein [Flavobacteriales bacterium]